MLLCWNVVNSQHAILLKGSERVWELSGDFATLNHFFSRKCDH